ncbi:polysaccharide biosynthesis protein [Leifsonia sp. AG29]|uniref:polysaccharide biosynthesis protein n=1 Tax=Leifsonia sp. AG29 TaxID=2598860 RepID=UPI001E5B5170|nr:nucleoside-diphosphate sugar epimerase/dehydratase [Leifsonia sp. AG29]
MAVRNGIFSERVRQETARRGETLLQRFGSQYALDALAWLVALLLAALLAYDFVTTHIPFPVVLFVAVVTMFAQLVIGGALSLYRGRYSYGSFEEVKALLVSVVSVAVVVGGPVIFFGNHVKLARSTMAMALPIAFVLMGGARYVTRLYVEAKLRPGDDAEPTLIFGAGYVGSDLVKRMMTDRHSPYLPIGLIDDDPRAAHRQIRGVRVLGRLTDVPAVAATTGARVIIVAIARVDAALLREVQSIAELADLQVKVLPSLEEVLAGHTRLSDVRDISIEDLIGRQPVDTDVEAIASYLSGRRVLVTGAGGSIGSELCRQIMRYEPSELIMLDRDETNLQSAQLAIDGHGLLDTRDVVLADIRDRDVLFDIFRDRRPQVVFHAAALKHLPMLEQYPDEAWKTNVLGTQNVLDAAAAVNVSTFVNISTDKAANPTSVLGHSKRMAEKLTAGAAHQTSARYLSVRFGNVIGSRGSMLPTFQALIDAGGPVTVTHPEVTRYFMTIPEACQLVVQAGGIGEPGEVLILDMGDPVSILDIANRMIAHSGKDIEIRFTGLRPGEKLHEELVGRGETDSRPRHPQISHTRIEPLAGHQLDYHRWMHRLRTNGADTAIIEPIRQEQRR